MGARGRVGRERERVGAAQRLEISDRLVQRRRIGVPERDRGLEVADRLGGRREQARALAGGGVRERRLAIVAGQLEVSRDDRRVGVTDPERLADAPVQQAPAREADAVLGDRPQPLVAEVVGVVALDDQPARRELLERFRDLVLRAAAREAQRVGVEGAPDQRGRAEHLPGRSADRVQARLDERPRAARGARAAGEQFGDEQRQALALAEHRLALVLVEAGTEREADDVLARQAPEHDAFAERCESRVAAVGVRLVGAPRAEQHAAGCSASRWAR